MKDRAPVLEEFTNWLVTAGLYTPMSFSTAEALRLAELISIVGLQMDCYCPRCKKSSTFSLKTSQKLRPAIPPTIGGGRHDTPHDRVQGYLPGVLAYMTFNCARGGTLHAMQFYLTSENLEHEEDFVVTKIGQLPSQFDLASGDLQRYAKLLDEDDMRELKSAAVCHSVGYHVAAFTYLRRVFERRIDVAHAVAVKDAGWDETAYAKLYFMEDRIDTLRGHLPSFLVEHRKVYNILSKGMHELTEQECAKGYATVLLGITLILDEEIERQQRAAKIKAAGISLQQLQQQYDK